MWRIRPYAPTGASEEIPAIGPLTFHLPPKVPTDVLCLICTPRLSPWASSPSAQPHHWLPAVWRMAVYLPKDCRTDPNSIFWTGLYLFLGDLNLFQVCPPWVFLVLGRVQYRVSLYTTLTLFLYSYILYSFIIV